MSKRISGQRRGVGEGHVLLCLRHRHPSQRTAELSATNDLVLQTRQLAREAHLERLSCRSSHGGGITCVV